MACGHPGTRVKGIKDAPRNLDAVAVFNCGHAPIACRRNDKHVAGFQSTRNLPQAFGATFVGANVVDAVGRRRAGRRGRAGSRECRRRSNAERASGPDNILERAQGSGRELIVAAQQQGDYWIDSGPTRTRHNLRSTLD
jgi:hypothetical protein